MSCVDPSVADIMLDSIVEKGCILGNDANFFTKRSYFYGSNVLAVNKDTTGLNVEESIQETKNGRFTAVRLDIKGREPAATWSYYGGFLTCWNDKTYILQYRSIGMVSKSNILKFNLSTFELEWFCIG